LPKLFSGLAALALSFAVTAAALPSPVSASFFVPYDLDVFSRTLAAGAVVFQKTPYVNRENNLEASGSYPLVLGMFDASFQTLVNNRVAAVIKAETAAAGADRALSLSFSYDIKTYRTYYSVIFYFTIVGASAKNKVDSIVFDTGSSAFLTITDCLGPNALQIADSVISKAILADPDKYNADTADIGNDQTFYIDNGMVYISYDNNEFGVDMSSVTDYTLKSGSYIIKDAYSINMIPLREVCEGLNFTVTWDPLPKSAAVSKGAFASSVTIDSNSYTKNQNSAKLEAPPELTNGQTYVPISYFDEILGAFYTINDDGSIVFSVYDESARS